MADVNDSPPVQVNSREDLTQLVTPYLNAFVAVQQPDVDNLLIDLPSDAALVFAYAILRITFLSRFVTNWAAGGWERDFPASMHPNLPRYAWLLTSRFQAKRPRLQIYYGKPLRCHTCHRSTELGLLVHLGRWSSRLYCHVDCLKDVH